ncbi:methyl-accepting chemotaxis protein [Paraburkholderia tropica]|uniref:Methyl-accepting chemotaxis sensory transducer with TarH sensor n=1 Tax=Paraburkholderia tropica TaxID=92647 RepID=A0AAQ1GE43_9BURK|nr:methyl-accepting chemotaxis protein [Paraburkholderia tropica]RQN37108.1 HAMP domain-containing protein [Paraburkholderia tropica]SEJ47778.1 methyl-accepting chemotaxis sensory transducer with TarH sensor [Paraburkholderia tropica]
MLHRWSIRTTLTGVGVILLALTVLVGALGLVALGNAGDSLATIARGDLVAMHSLNDASSYLLRSRVSLDRANSLYAAGQNDEAKKVIDRADVLLGKSNDAWKVFQSAPKAGIDAATLDTLNTKRASLLSDGVQPEFTALRANDLAAYHAIADTKISPMFVDYDNSAAPIAQQLQDGAQAREESARSQISLMRTLIGAVILVALVLVVAIRFAMRGLIVQPLEDAVKSFERIAQGDLTERIEVYSNNEIGRLFAGVKRMQDSLVSLVSAVHNGAGSIDVGAREIAMGNTDLSQRTEQQAASLQETASSMEQLTGTVRQNAENARQASQLAVNASDIATRGGEVVGEVVHTMQDIAASSAKVVDIISVIEGIAFQTNILALNAAVEAARAGEQGRGFAVVAGEVRTLAQRSAGAAKEIKELINDSAQKVQSGSQLVGRAGTTMDDILQAVRRVTDIMGEISAASEEQSSGIEQVNRAVTQMDTVTQQNAALVEQAAAAAASLEEQTRNLQGVLGTWRTNGADRGDRADRADRGASNGVSRAHNVTKPSVSAAPAVAAKTDAQFAAAPAKRVTPTASAAAKPAAAAAATATGAKAAPAAKAAVRAEPQAAPVRVAASAKDDSDWETF